MRHRPTKGAGTDRPNLPPPRHISTLPIPDRLTRRTLRAAGLVRGEPRGPFVFYCLADPALLALIDDVRKWTATRNAQAPKHPQEAATRTRRFPAR